MIINNEYRISKLEECASQMMGISCLLYDLAKSYNSNEGTKWILDHMSSEIKRFRDQICTNLARNQKVEPDTMQYKIMSFGKLKQFISDYGINEPVYLRKIGKNNDYLNLSDISNKEIAQYIFNHKASSDLVGMYFAANQGLYVIELNAENLCSKNLRFDAKDNFQIV